MTGPPFHVYFVRSIRSGRLLYIGCAGDLNQRMRGHAADRTFGRVRVYGETKAKFALREDALEEERRLIELHDPPHNLNGTTRKKARRKKCVRRPICAAWPCRSWSAIGDKLCPLCRKEIGADGFIRIERRAPAKKVKINRRSKLFCPW